MFYLLKNGISREDLLLRMARHVAAVQVRDDFMWSSSWLSTHENKNYKIHDDLSCWASVKHRKLFFSECSRLGCNPKKIELIPEHF